MSDERRVGNDAAATPDPAVADDTAEREASFTRRALLRAGWTTPVIIAAALPQSAAAQTAHADSHTDVFHTDTPPHGDSPHGDQPQPPHTDVPHTDTPPHTDVPHSDSHTDFP